MQLLLIHGRKSHTQSTDGWGYHGEPITDIAHMHVTYFTTWTIGLRTHEAFLKAREMTGWKEWDDKILEITITDDLIRCGDDYYGDWELIGD